MPNFINGGLRLATGEREARKEARKKGSNISKKTNLSILDSEIKETSRGKRGKQIGKDGMGRLGRGADRHKGKKVDNSVLKSSWGPTVLVGGAPKCGAKLARETA